MNDAVIENPRAKVLAAAAFAILALLVISGIRPYERMTWALEIFPIVIAMPILVVTFRRHPFTTLTYAAICVHAIVLMVGGHYTYARVPLGFWLAEAFGWQRNPYDKIGHFMQGFVPALVVREVLLRGDRVRGRKTFAALVIASCLAISAVYELLEWAAAVVLGQGADEFLGTQGDPFDTQSDMFFALIGAVCAVGVCAIPRRARH